MFLVLGQTSKVYLQLSGLAQPAAEISWFVSRICRRANVGAKLCRMRRTFKEVFYCFHIHKFVLADSTFGMEAALPTRHALTTGQTVGSSRLLQVRRYRPFGLGKGQGCGRVTQAVPAAPVFVHHSGLGLLINGARCWEEAS